MASSSTFLHYFLPLSFVQFVRFRSGLMIFLKVPNFLLSLFSLSLFSSFFLPSSPHLSIFTFPPFYSLLLSSHLYSHRQFVHFVTSFLLYFICITCVLYHPYCSSVLVATSSSYPKAIFALIKRKIKMKMNRSNERV